jgi:hypothetical protein
MLCLKLLRVGCNSTVELLPAWPGHHELLITSSLDRSNTSPRITLVCAFGQPRIGLR